MLKDEIFNAEQIYDNVRFHAQNKKPKFCRSVSQDICKEKKK